MSRNFISEINATAARFRDPIYGFIPVTDAELKIIDTPIFQRLRRVGQLALTKYVYPSTEHSRFVHSLGVMHCTTLVYEGIINNKLSEISFNPNEKMIKTLRFAALLHDVGHLPFSHAVEKHWLKSLTHEDVGIFIIKNHPDISNIIKSDGVDCADVASLLTKKPKRKHQLLHEIISGQLDADRADYLLRDSYFSGTQYGKYDFLRFLSIFAAKEDDNGTLTLFVDEKNLPVAESLLIARYHYNLQVPYHRTRSGYDIVLKKFVETNIYVTDMFKIDENKIENINFNKFEITDDGTIFEQIKDKFVQGEFWSEFLMRKKHLKPIIDTNNIAHGGKFFKKVVRSLERSGRFIKDKDYFLQEQKVEMLKKVISPFAGEGGEGGNQELPEGTIRLYSPNPESGIPEFADIRERSWIFGRLKEEPHFIFRLYVVPEKYDAMRKFISDELSYGEKE